MTIHERGFFFHVPGLTTAIAGSTIAVGTVDHFDEDGVPIVESAEDVSQRGHFPEDVDFGAAICAALT